MADTVGRKASLAVGTAVMGASILLWAVAPSVMVVTLAYAALAVGATFLSGADDALFYESLHRTDRAGEYARLAGRASAMGLGFVALGNLSSGLLAALDLRLPFLVAGITLLALFVVVLAFKEPYQPHQENADSTGPVRKSYGEIVRQSFVVLRTHPVVRNALLYLAFAPMTAVILETVFLQPQALALGVPLAAVGAVVMAVQFANMAGSASASRIEERFGGRMVLISAPVVIVVCLFLLAAFQALPSLLFVAIIGFVTAVLRPLVLHRIHNEVPDEVRATVLSLQALIFTVAIALCEPLLGWVADQSGLPASYVALAVGLSLVMVGLFWMSKRTIV